MPRNANLVGIFLVLGVALGYALGLYLTDPAVAVLSAGTGAGVGILLGAIATSLRDQGSPQGR
ncbi:MAG TPA: hypothetical protein VF013_01625 [Candidatus Limnocylindria bacterium]